MKNRRGFIKSASLAAAGVTVLGCVEGSANDLLVVEPSALVNSKPTAFPLVVSTWNHGIEANKGALQMLNRGGTILDAVEAGVRVTESDPKNQSVGLGGLPDRNGHVTLDACIMNHKSECGAVSFLQNIKNPISVARKVMEVTPHVMLSGQGAFDFAIENGFAETNLLTDSSRAAWEKWKAESKYSPKINSENHDTIGMLGIDKNGQLAGACTTSGMAYKLHGRVGDSPIIGAGLFVDGDVGAACATGVGEAVIRIAGSAIVVELMRGGATPEEACKEAVERIIKKHDDLTNMQVGFLALDKFGNTGGYSVYSGFNFACGTPLSNKMVDAKYSKDW